MDINFFIFLIIFLFFYKLTKSAPDCFPTKYQLAVEAKR